jgi:hypothetical protein
MGAVFAVARADRPPASTRRSQPQPPPRPETNPTPGVAGHAHRKWGDDYTSGATIVRVLSLLMLSLSILIAVWAGFNFNHRANMLT